MLMNIVPSLNFRQIKSQSSTYSWLWRVKESDGNIEPSGLPSGGIFRWRGIYPAQKLLALGKGENMEELQ